MGRDVIPRLESYADFKSFAEVVGYSLFIILFPRVALMFGGMVLWVLLLYRWISGVGA